LCAPEKVGRWPPARWRRTPAPSAARTIAATISRTYTSTYGIGTDAPRARDPHEAGELGGIACEGDAVHGTAPRGEGHAAVHARVGRHAPRGDRLSAGGRVYADEAGSLIARVEGEGDEGDHSLGAGHPRANQARAILNSK